MIPLEPHSRILDFAETMCVVVRFHGDVIKSLNITHDDITMIMADFTQEMNKVEEFMKIV